MYIKHLLWVWLCVKSRPEPSGNPCLSSGVHSFICMARMVKVRFMGSGDQPGYPADRGRVRVWVQSESPQVSPSGLMYAVVRAFQKQSTPPGPPPTLQRASFGSVSPGLVTDISWNCSQLLHCPPGDWTWPGLEPSPGN